MSTPPPVRRIPFALSSRGLRFRVLVGDDSGYAVTRRIGLGGALVRSSIVPAVGTRIRLLERYGVPGADVCIEADVVAVIAEPALDGTEPGFVAEFRDITVRGGEHNLVEFIHALEPGYVKGAAARDSRERGDVIAAIRDDLRGACTRFSPGTRWALGPLLHAAGVGQHGGDDLGWDDGLEDVDLSSEVGTNLTPVADREATTIPLAVAAPPRPPDLGPPPEPTADPNTRRRKRGITGIFGNIFGKSRDADDDNG